MIQLRIFKISFHFKIIIYVRMMVVINMKKLSVSILSMILLLMSIVTQVPTVQAKSNVDTSMKDKLLNQINLEGTHRLMIIAHPDDETIWGGDHIMKEKYFIVCITNGDHQERVNEFEAVMKKTGNPYLMLHYPDKTNGKRDNWDNVKAAIQKDLNTVISYKEWDYIVTHNPDGEYGHIHHKMISSMVTQLCKEKQRTYSLTYFGKYYKKKHMNLMYTKQHLSKEEVIQKNDLFKPYKSQMLVKQHLYHMFPYENWVSYQNWYIETGLSAFAEAFSLSFKSYS